ncbi:MAG: TldD/PmbA family protein [Clostridia bacterium]|nr:TldD/PmbA family protein [Clostridia bacterium]
MINKNTAEAVLLSATSTGAEFAELFVESNVKNTIGVVNGKVERANSGIDCGCGIRIINKDKVIYVYTNKLDKDNLVKLAGEGAKVIKGKSNIKNIVFSDLDIYRLYVPEIMPESVNKRDIVSMMRLGSEAAYNYDKLITQTNLSYMDSTQNVIIANSEGLWAEDERVRTRIAVSAVASEGNEKQTGYFGPGALKGFEFYNTINIEDISREAARSAVTMLKADDCPSGKMPVIMDNGFGGVIFHEACGHGLEAAAISKSASVFTNKIGQKIASDKLTAIDDGTIAGSWGSINIDDEGIRGQKNILIKDGVLKNYMVDRHNGSLIGMEPTGSSRRESYRYVPVSRMTNTYIAAGKDKKEDIISSTEYGLYAKYMGGGSVNPASGDFNFAVSEAYIIRNGKICEPVRGATLIGKGSEVLLNIDMISDNLALAEGMCGASSGAVPVCVGQPMLRVQNITVGGRA